MPSAEDFFVRPANLDEALEALERPDAMLVGGATATTLLLKNRLIDPSCLVWVGALSELSGITETPDGGIEVGATTTLRDIARSELIHAKAPALAEAAGEVGNPRGNRAMATLGGALVHGDPRQDVPPVLLSYRALLEVVSARGTRTIALSDFFLGFMQTALEPDEIVTKVTLPRSGWREAYFRYTPGSEDDYPTVGVAVSLLVEGGEIRDAEIALGGVDGSAVRVPEAAALLVGTSGGAEVLTAAGTRAVEGCNPSDDQRGSAAYKQAMVKVWTERTIAACLD